MPAIGQPVQYFLGGYVRAGVILRTEDHDKQVAYVLFFDESTAKWTLSARGVVEDIRLESDNTWRPLPKEDLPVLRKEPK